MKADARRQRGIEWIAEVSEQEHRVGYIDEAIAVHIAKGNIAAVGQYNGRIQAIHCHEQSIGHIDLTIAVHIAQNPACGALHPRTAVLFNHKVHLIDSHLKSWVHMRDQPLARNSQSIDRTI